MVKIDIPMPSCCLLCPLGHTNSESPFSHVWCKYLNHLIHEGDAKERRAKECPLLDGDEREAVDEAYKKGFIDGTLQTNALGIK